MPRPQKYRRICAMPRVKSFAPSEFGASGVIAMTIDEYETIRLMDLLGCTQEECAAQMGVARTTVQAVYGTARRKLAEALVEGKRLEIGGGTYVHTVEGGVAFGAERGDTDYHMHGADEFITVDELLRDAVLFAEAIAEICG